MHSTVFILPYFRTISGSLANDSASRQVSNRSNGIRPKSALVGDGVAVNARRTVAEIRERRSVALEVARDLQGHLPLAVVAEAQQRPDDGLLAVLLGEGLV